MRYLIGAVLVLLLAIFALLQFGPLPHRTNTVMKFVTGTVLVLSLMVVAIGLFGPRPHYVDTFKTPLPGVTLTFETTSLPLTSDDNFLVAHYEHDGKKDSSVILGGHYAGFYRYVWVSPQRLELCWEGGEIFDFRNEIDLQAGGGRQHFHVALREDCTP